MENHNRNNKFSLGKRLEKIRKMKKRGNHICNKWMFYKRGEKLHLKIEQAYWQPGKKSRMKDTGTFLALYFNHKNFYFLLFFIIFLLC